MKCASSSPPYPPPLILLPGDKGLTFIVHSDWTQQPKQLGIFYGHVQNVSKIAKNFKGDKNSMYKKTVLFTFYLDQI